MNSLSVRRACVLTSSTTLKIDQIWQNLNCHVLFPKSLRASNGIIFKYIGIPFIAYMSIFFLLLHFRNNNTVLLFFKEDTWFICSNVTSSTTQCQNSSDDAIQCSPVSFACICPYRTQGSIEIWVSAWRKCLVTF